MIIFFSILLFFLFLIIIFGINFSLIDFLYSKGEWLPKEGRFENLKYGQWKHSFFCDIFGHSFKDFRIFDKHKPQKWENCERCGLERTITS